MFFFEQRYSGTDGGLVIYILTFVRLVLICEKRLSAHSGWVSGHKLTMSYNANLATKGLGIFDAQKFLTLSKPELHSLLEVHFVKNSTLENTISLTTDGELVQSI
ncbi:MAG: hypothetical protein P1P64_07180 [Treponemataceae bacterium]